MDRNLNSCKTPIFSTEYPEINEYLVQEGKRHNSRYGTTKRIKNFKLELTNPIARCVGGCKRDANIFFLLAEALWIWSGRKDVAFLTKFNARMAEFSDDGKVFHAPYGFRLRDYGRRSNHKKMEEHLHIEPFDQIKTAIKLLTTDPDTRRCVLAIWNPELDLDEESKDIPCNDLLFYRIDDGELNLTIANRSNDLHWGLPTNVFQFSFISEMLSKIIGVKYTNQVHNSADLHIYKDNRIAKTMYEAYDQTKIHDEFGELYCYCDPTPMKFNFTNCDPGDRLLLLDIWVHRIIQNLEGRTAIDLKRLNSFSPYLHKIHQLLSIYLKYKAEYRKGRNDEIRENALKKLSEMRQDYCSDYQILAMNFFAKRLNDYKIVNKYTGMTILGKL